MNSESRPRCVYAAAGGECPADRTVGPCGRHWEPGRGKQSAKETGRRRIALPAQGHDKRAHRDPHVAAAWPQAGDVAGHRPGDASLMSLGHESNGRGRPGIGEPQPGWLASAGTVRTPSLSH
jgi:hypothetical protein